LSNGSTINITKTWSQQPTGYTYPMEISVPSGAVPEDGFPVCILLHGHGGNGGGAIAQFGNLLNCHVLVAPSGYANSWNIADEASEAPDVEMVSDLIVALQAYNNINPNKIRILGYSNGAALANRVFIENTNTGVDIICAIVSQLSEAQYHNGSFHYPSSTTGGSDPYDGYDTPTTPLTGRKYLGIFNENDPIIPYNGGPSVGVNFLPAQLATYFIAQSQGYTGTQLPAAGMQIGTSNSYEYSYLSGQVVHIKGDASHGTNVTQRDYISTFFDNCTSSPSPTSGCTDPDALNYNPAATVDDGSCNYSTTTLTNTTVIAPNYTWSQEPDSWTYPVAISVPDGPMPTGGFPVCILLHGNGGNGNGMIMQWSNHLDCHILVAPSGYANSWNISDEASEAPDVAMMEQLILQLQTYTNVNPNKIRVLGSSNGAALANRVFIENTNTGVDIICAIVSHLSEAQYHNGDFHYPSGPTGGADQYDGYDIITTPITGRRYLGISNTNDLLIPYDGGPSLGVNFLHAQSAAYIIAQSQGYVGTQLSNTGTQLGTSNVYEFAYLAGQVVHLNGDAGHSINATQISYIQQFLHDCDSDEDGFFVGDDCDDGNAAVNPNGVEIANNGIDEDCDGADLVTAAVVLQAQVFLEGVYENGGIMFTHLNEEALLPNNQPFNQMPWNYAGSESVSVFASNVVDWVLVELLAANNPALIIERRAALLLSDGTIVDADGTTQGLNFYDISSGEDYYVLVRQRNHIGVISATTVELPNASPYNFSQANNVWGGETQLALMENDIFALKAGDCNADGIISVADFNVYTNGAAQINIYASSDINLDGWVTIDDFNKYQMNTSAIGVNWVRY